MSLEMQSQFSRTLANISKAGAYYTDTDCCRVIGQMLSFPEEEVSCLEPSIGDGSAILAVTGKTAEKGNIKIFGIDIDKDVVAKNRENPLLDEVLEADFLNGVAVSGNAFSFCFSNPPYMTVDKERAERLFLHKISDKLKKGGVLVYVIPYSVFSERGFFRVFYNRFHMEKVYRFPDREFDKWKQVAIIARKLPVSRNVLKDELDEAISVYDSLEKLEVLPSEYTGEKVQVLPSDASRIGTFAPLIFPREECLAFLKSGVGRQHLRDADRVLSSAITLEDDAGELERPPIHPNNDSMYLLSVCGAGNGLCGSEAEQNLHLQRGVVKMVEDSRVESGENGSGVVIVTQRASITYNVIEDDGRITSLA